MIHTFFTHRRRKRRQLFCASLAMPLAWAAPPAFAQQEDRPIRIVVPFPPGGSNDIIGRVIAQELTSRLKRSVVVVNMPGGGGTIGASNIAKAAPDGANLLLISATFTMNEWAMTLPYDPTHSFTPVAMLGMGPSVIVTHPDLPVNTMKDLVGFSHQNPGVVNFSTSGPGSFQHFAAALLKLRTGVDITIVHYRGGGPALNDLAAGNVHVTLGSLIQMQAYLQSGRIKLIGVSGEERVAQIPDTPTLKEDGYDVDLSNWWGLLAPRDTPDATLDTLHQHINAVLTSPELKRRLANEAAQPAPMHRAQFRRFLADQTQRWKTVAEQTGIKNS